MKPRPAILPALLAVCVLLAPAAPAAADSISDKMGLDERSLAEGVRSGRLGKEELIAVGEGLTYFQKFQLYYYGQALAPFFEGLEDSLRDLARLDPRDRAAVARARGEVARVMLVCWRRLERGHRENPALDWRRGLAGLIFLDRDWRRRVAEQGKDEIKNPYDLVALLDCLDARLRGLEPGPPADCPAGPATTPAKETKAP